jgi:hypothetical protein
MRIEYHPISSAIRLDYLEVKLTLRTVAIDIPKAITSQGLSQCRRTTSITPDSSFNSRAIDITCSIYRSTAVRKSLVNVNLSSGYRSDSTGFILHDR